MKYIVFENTDSLSMGKKKSIQLSLLKEWIIHALKMRKSALNIKQISWEIGLKGSQYRKQILRAISDLMADKLIKEAEKYKFQYQEPDHLISGIIDINKSGNGYVNSEKYSEDIFIHRKNRLNSLNQDTVSVKMIKGKKHTLEGCVTKVISRKNTKFIGNIRMEKGGAFFIPNNPKTGSDFFISKEHLKGSVDNDRVIVKLNDWPPSAGCPFGEVIKIIKNTTDLKTEIEATIEVSGIRASFSKEVNEELKQLPTKISKLELNKRKDLRNENTFTIDPIDAKDFDDAISVKVLSNNNIKIGVHIADVSHYVRSKSAIDKEAFLRAFSVYFPGKVVPMLPEKLSNRLCSLRPNEDKLAFSVEFELTDYTSIKSIWIGKTVINSNKRFTYEGAEKIISEKRGEFSDELEVLNNVAKNLRNARIKNGSINFERNNIAFELDDNNEPIKIIKENSLSAHKLVEEFMLLANKAIAQKLSKLPQSIYRVHDTPDINKIKELIIYLKGIDPNMPTNISHRNSSQFINKILKQDNKNINNAVVENLVLRSMSKAEYSSKNIGHYGLGFDKYTHFTSPIRRYADLMIHRILHQAIVQKKVNLFNLDKKCSHFSTTERIYIDIERKINKFIQLKLLKDSIGATFNGSISGIVKWGIYVELEGGQGEGLISNIELNDDNYYYNESKYAFIARTSGKKYVLGQNVIVEIKNICLLKREMDLVFTN